MKLTELNPKLYSSGEGRSGMGVSFDCPCATCAKAPHLQIRIGVQFENPIDGGKPFAAGKLWKREGETFETLSLSPSIDVSHLGHWHGSITSGELTGAPSA